MHRQGRSTVPSSSRTATPAARTARWLAVALLAVASFGCATLAGISDLEEVDEAGNPIVDSSQLDGVADTREDTADTLVDTAAEASCDETGTTQSCGASCRACSSANVASATCSATGTCTSTCKAGFLNCTQPAAPAADDGCETTQDGANCGACGTACDSLHSEGATCAAGACVYAACKPGWVNCDTTGGDFNGCETPSNTLDNCGGCGNKCDATHSSGATCNGTSCIYAKCSLGYADCNTTAPDTDGCETVVDPTNCAGCGMSCDVANSVGSACSAGTCTYTSCKPGYADCNTSPPNTNGCESKLDSPQHCLACGNVCDTANSLGASCGATGCQYTACKSGFGNCVTTAPDTDGCETALNSVLNCTACGVKCDSVNSNNPTCGTTSCQYSGCKAGYGDCDTAGTNANGCETKLNTTTNCGDCGRACSLTNATSTACVVAGALSTCGAVCKPGFGNCVLPNSPAADDGCETPLNTTTNCAACGATCDTVNSVGAACNGSKCTYSACAPGYGDCNTAAPDTDGCETQLNTINNCGGCGIKCDTATSAGAACIAGKCVYTGCSAGYSDCDQSGANANGCETPLTSTNNCGTCGAKCDTATSGTATCNYSASGTPATTCTYATCSAGYADCSKTAPDTDGCETPITTVTNCSGCGKACDTIHSTPSACTGGSCQYSACASGYADCSKTAPDLDGCETPTTTTTNCGGCGRLCNSTNTTAANLSCSGTGTCNSACNVGFVNCNQPAAPSTDDGCECAGNGCCGTGCQTSHNNGVGQKFYDCAPLGTYNVTQATEAAAAATSQPGSTTLASCGTGASVQSVLCKVVTFSTTTGACTCWTYAATGTYASTLGLVYTTTTAGCGCPNPGVGNPTWN
jgi:hypothetical protein